MAALELKDVSFAYPDGNLVVNDASLAVEQGEFVLLVGDTGSGKTTLLRSIKSEIAPAGDLQGEIRVFGKNVYDADYNECGEYIGFVFQNPDSQLVCETVVKELAFGLECKGEDPTLMCKKIAEIVSYLGMTEWVSEKTEDLSGGQKQLVNLASVLVLQPSLLLLDEPTAQLDPISARLFLDMLFHINKDLGTTIIVATHSPEQMLSYATRVISIDKGALEESSLPPDLGIQPFVALDSRKDRLNVLNVRKNARSDAHGDSSQAVTFENVSYAYEDSKSPVLHGLSMSVSSGETFAFVGSNGSGKTTLLKLAAGILKSLSGKVSNACRDNQAYLSQDPQVLFTSDTVIEELSEWSTSAGYSDENVREIVDQMGLGPILHSNPFDTSGGQKQLIALSKLLLCSPKLLILDEPVKGLDAKMCFTMGRKLKEAAGTGTTILMATHNLAFAACIADRMVMLFDGGIAADQPSSDFCNGNYFYCPRSNSFSRMWEAWERSDKSAYDA